MLRERERERKKQRIQVPPNNNSTPNVEGYRMYWPKCCGNNKRKAMNDFSRANSSYKIKPLYKQTLGNEDSIL